MNPAKTQQGKNMAKRQSSSTLSAQTKRGTALKYKGAASDISEEKNIF